MPMRPLSFAILVASFLLGSASCEVVASERLTDAGRVSGVQEDRVAVFRGIPYAAAPTGELRWRPPEQPPPWSGVRQADVFGPSCPQPPVPAPAGPEGPTSEDCLTLNIWEPIARTTEKLPVMVWIHGGGFFLGSGSQPLYDGAELARRGAVVVTFNYRLGALGFLAHPALTNEQAGHPLGNYGLLDQIALLQWVQRNIASFGGDPDNVTVFGESAGGVSVQALMTSPLADGLFSKAISQSGMGNAQFLQAGTGRRLAEELGRTWAAMVGGNCGEVLGTALEKSVTAAYVPVEESGKVAAGSRIDEADEISTAALRRLSVDQIIACPFSAFPSIDGHVLLRSPYQTFRRGEQARVPFIVGANSFEGSLAVLSENIARAAIGRDYDDLLAAYSKDASSVEVAKNQLRGEFFFVQPSRNLARYHAKLGVPTYLYYFDQVPASQRDTLVGAPHGGEIAYVFGTPHGFLSEWDDHDRELSNIVSAYWVRFASTGSPNKEGAQEWNPVDLDSDSFLHLADTIKMVQSAALADRMLETVVHSAATRDKHGIDR